MIRIHTVLHFGFRAGILSVLNIIPLFFSDWLSLITNFLGLSFCGYWSIHGTVAYMALIQDLIHTIITVCQGFCFHQLFHFYELFVSCIMNLPCEILITTQSAVSFGTIFVLDLFYVACYELYTKLHRLVAMCLVILLWQYLSILPSFSQFYIIIVVGIFALMTFLHFLQILFQHAIYNSFHSSTQVVRIPI